MSERNKYADFVLQLVTLAAILGALAVLVYRLDRHAAALAEAEDRLDALEERP